MPPREFFEMNMRLYGIWCILRHNVEKFYSGILFFSRDHVKCHLVSWMIFPIKLFINCKDNNIFKGGGGKLDIFLIHSTRYCQFYVNTLIF